MQTAFSETAIISKGSSQANSAATNHMPHQKKAGEYLSFLNLNRSSIININAAQSNINIIAFHLSSDRTSPCTS